MPPQQQQFAQINARSYTNNDTKKRVIDVGECQVKEIGLESFIRRIVKEIDLHLTNDVVFNLNERGIIYKWKDVFEVESVYSKCLGISNRLYECHSYIHEPQTKVTYFMLEEYNQRTISFLPEFKFYVVVFCYYDSNMAVTKVDVQYDQMSFFLHCLGMVQLHRWICANVLTPFAVRWMRLFKATGCVNPFTFIFQVLLMMWLLYYKLF
jgi:hypothetical protein